MSNLNLDQKDAFLHRFIPQPKKVRTATDKSKKFSTMLDRRCGQIDYYKTGEEYWYETMLSDWDDDDLMESNSVFNRWLR